MHHDSDNGGDPIGYRGEFVAAVYDLAVMLGNCRLFAVRLYDGDGVLPAGFGYVAACELIAKLALWTEQARKLPERYAETDEPIEAEQLCYDLLEIRMEAWAATIAITEAYKVCLDAVPCAVQPPYETIMKALIEAIDTFDSALQSQQSFLAVASETNMLENWKAQLALPYTAVLPWWLDGRLKLVNDQVIAQAIASQPRKIPE